MVISKGEVRQVGIEVISQVKQNFIIELADYKIKTAEGSELESGSATVDGNKILTLFSATDVGKFIVEFTYRIGPEILKAKIYMEVVR